MHVLKDLHIIPILGGVSRPNLEMVPTLTAQLLANKNNTCRNNYCLRFEVTVSFLHPVELQ